MDLFSNLFGPNFNKDLSFEDRPKARALLAVACKSTASLEDLVTLATALDLKLSISAHSIPKPPKEATPDA